AEFPKLGMYAAAMASLPPEMALRIESMISEELGWGDSGLAVSIGAGSMALEVASSLANQELLDLTIGRIGCWIGTKPDFGSDFQIFDMQRDLPEWKSTR